MSQEIDGWMSDEELAWLEETAKGMRSVLEIGSYKGRSIRALSRGCSGLVVAVDLWPDQQTFFEFVRNTMYVDFPERNGLVVPIRASSLSAYCYLPGDFDMIFIDADHSYDSVFNDIHLWEGRANKILCGHDYSQQWPGVMKAVDDLIGPVEVIDSIWCKRK
jgi:hypothetical protein